MFLTVEININIALDTVRTGFMSNIISVPTLRFYIILIHEFIYHNSCTSIFIVPHCFRDRKLDVGATYFTENKKFHRK